MNYYDLWIWSDLLFAFGRRKQRVWWCRRYRGWPRCRLIDDLYYSLLWQPCRRHGPVDARKEGIWLVKKNLRPFRGDRLGASYMGFNCDIAWNYFERLIYHATERTAVSWTTEQWSTGLGIIGVDTTNCTTDRQRDGS